MMCPELFRVSLCWPALAAAAVLTATPALAAGLVPPRPGEPAERCFDPVSVVLGAKPHRDPEAMARRAEGRAARSQPPAAPTDARPILTLVMERPRDCKGPLNWGSASAPPMRFGMLDGEPDDGLDTPLHAALVVPVQGVGAGDMAPPAPASPLADSATFADPVHPEDRVAGGLAIGDGLVQSSSLVHGVGGRSAVGALAPPNSGFSVPAAPQGAASPVTNPPEVPSAAGGSPGESTVTSGIATVPESATWTLLVLGLFGLGAALRQRRTPSAVGRAI
jgi:hypothetical protein